MSAKSRVRLYFLTPESTINGSKYVELFKKKLVLHMEIHNCTTFMYDGAPCHKSRLVQQFFESQNVKVLD